MSDLSPEEIAKDMLTPKRFKFTDALRNRTHPEEEVNVYLDEAEAFKLLDVNKRGDQVKHDITRFGAPVTEIDIERFAKLEALRDEIEVERQAITKALEPSKYVVTVRGVEPGFEEDALKVARDEYPIEYEEYQNPITGARVKEEKPSPERDRYFTNMLWQAHVVKIVNTDGAADIAPDLETVSAMRRQIPVASRNALEVAIDKVDMAVDWYKGLADESFLAKS